MCAVILGEERRHIGSIDKIVSRARTNRTLLECGALHKFNRPLRWVLCLLRTQYAIANKRNRNKNSFIQQEKRCRCEMSQVFELCAVWRFGSVFFFCLSFSW